MRVKKLADGFIIVLERGDSVIETLTAFAHENNISCATFSAIGAVRLVSLGYYDLSLKKYFFNSYLDDHEVVSATGNIALKNGMPFIHLHMVMSTCDGENKCIGGHVEKAEVAVTLEVFMRVYESELERKLDDTIGLSLLCP